MRQGKLVEHGDLHAEELLVAWRLGDGLAEGVGGTGGVVVVRVRRAGRGGRHARRERRYQGRGSDVTQSPFK